MTEAPATNSKSKPRPVRKAAVGRLFVLELSGGRIHSMSPDGSDRKVIVTDCHLPDGIAVDVGAGHIYWTNMGSIPAQTMAPSSVPISTERIAGSSFRRASRSRRSRSSSIRRTASSTGATAKGCASCARISTARRSKRSSRRVVATRIGAIRPGGALASPSIPNAKQIYWTQKGPDNGEQGRIFRAGIEIPKGETAAEPLRHRGVLRPLAGADRSRARPQESRPLLDRPRRPSARQHGEPRIRSMQSRKRRRSC